MLDAQLLVLAPDVVTGATAHESSHSGRQPGDSPKRGDRPAPQIMVEIGGKPILWHVMKIYSAYGVHDFIICCGYKGYMIKEYFANYFLHMSNVTFDLRRNQMEVHERYAELWRFTLVDTGEQ